MDRLALEQFRLAALEQLPSEVLDDVPAVRRTLLAERGDPPRLVVDLGYHEWGIYPTSTKAPEGWDPERGALDPLYTFAHLVELGLPLHGFRVFTGFFEKPKASDLKPLGRYEPVKKLPGLSFVSMKLKKAAKILAPALTSATRLDFSGSKIDLAGLAAHDWPALEYVGLNRTVGDTADLAALVERMPSLRGAGLPAAALEQASPLAERARAWDFLELCVSDADSVRRIGDDGWLGDSLTHLRIEGWARGGPSTPSAVTGAKLPALVTLDLTAVGEEELPEALELPALRALAIAPYYPKVLDWLASQPCLGRLDVLDLDARAVKETDGVATALRSALAGDASVVRLGGPSSKAGARELLGDASSESVRALELREMPVSAGDIETLAAQLPNLEALSISAPLTAEVADALGAFGERLLSFECSGAIDSDAFDRLLEQPCARSLQCLGLPRVRLNEAQLRRFVDAEMPGLVEAHFDIGKIEGDRMFAFEPSHRKPHLAWLSGVVAPKDARTQTVRSGPAAMSERLEWGDSFLLSPRYQ